MTLEEAKKLYPAIIAIYDHPADYPQGYVAREWYGDVPGEGTLHPTLESARTLLRARGFTFFKTRWDMDDPVIVETWI